LRFDLREGPLPLLGCRLRKRKATTAPILSLLSRREVKEGSNIPRRPEKSLRLTIALSLKAKEDQREGKKGGAKGGGEKYDQRKQTNASAPALLKRKKDESQGPIKKESWATMRGNPAL